MPNNFEFSLQFAVDSIIITYSNIKFAQSVYCMYCALTSLCLDFLTCKRWFVSWNYLFFVPWAVKFTNYRRSFLPFVFYKIIPLLCTVVCITSSLQFQVIHWPWASRMKIKFIIYILFILI